MGVQVGALAPDFKLQDTEGRFIQLSDYRGEKNVVLLFFPLAFTSTCTEELCSTRDNLKIYNSLDAEVLGISSADSFYVLKEYKASQNLNFNLLSDFNRTAAKSYGVLYNDFYGMYGVSKRSAFIIDKAGEIRYSEVLEDADKIPDFGQLIDTLSELEQI